MKRKRSTTSKKSAKRAKTVAVVPATALFPTRNKQQFFVPRTFGNPRAITERKYYTQQRTTVALSDLSAGTDWAGCELDPATVLTLFAPTTGDDFNNRDGRKVQVISIKVKGYFDVPAQANQAATDSAALIRLILVQDKQTNAAQLNAEDVVGGVANAANNINQFQNPTHFGRFRVIKDKLFNLQNPAIGFDGTNIEQNGLKKTFKFNIKFRKPQVVHFNATNGGTVADVIDNSWHIIGGSQGISLAPTIQYQVRTTFIDL